MNSTSWKAVIAITLLFIFSGGQICVGGAVQSLLGKLKTRGNKSISVNGSSATSGTTITSGAQLQTPQGVGATVNLGSLGRVDIAPNTNFTLTFTEGNVAANLKEGYVILTTKKGVTGSVTHPDGSIAMTDPSKLSSVVGQTPGSPGPTAAGGVGAAGGGLSGAAIGGIVAAAGAAVAGGAAAASGGDSGRSSNPSPSSPQ